MFGFAGSLAHGQDGGCGGYSVSDANKGFLRNVASAGACEGKNSGSNKGERQAEPVCPASVRVHANQDRDGCSEGSNLRECQIDKDDSTFYDMYAKIGMDSGQDQAGNKRPE